MQHVAGALVAVSMLGCGVSTSTLEAHFSVTSHDGWLTFDAFFEGEDEDDTLVELDDGDRVIVTFRGHEIVLADELPTDHGYYRTELDVDTPVVADEPVTFVVVREGDGDALASSVTAPPPLALDPLPLFISRSSDVTFSWSPISDDPMWWRIDSWCPTAGGEIPPGVGSATMPARPSDMSTDDHATCTATLEVKRRRRGTVDPAFASGHISFAHLVTHEFASTR